VEKSPRCGDKLGHVTAVADRAARKHHSIRAYRSPSRWSLAQGATARVGMGRRARFGSRPAATTVPQGSQLKEAIETLFSRTQMYVANFNRRVPAVARGPCSLWHPHLQNPASIRASFPCAIPLARIKSGDEALLRPTPDNGDGLSRAPRLRGPPFATTISSLPVRAYLPGFSRSPRSPIRSPTISIPKYPTRRASKPCSDAAGSRQAPIS